MLALHASARATHQAQAVVLSHGMLTPHSCKTGQLLTSLKARQMRRHAAITMMLRCCAVVAVQLGRAAVT